MNKPQITIKDIARALNVATFTVSRALKASSDIINYPRTKINASSPRNGTLPNSFQIYPLYLQLEIRINWNVVQIKDERKKL